MPLQRQGIVAKDTSIDDPNPVLCVWFNLLLIRSAFRAAYFPLGECRGVTCVGGNTVDDHRLGISDPLELGVVEETLDHRVIVSL